MGRKMGMRGRPGLLFLCLVVVFIIIFILSWRSMKTPEKQEVKDIYSPVNFEALRRREQVNQEHSAFNEFQSPGKGLYNQENLDKDLQYQLGKNFMLERARMAGKVEPTDTKSKSKIDESPLSALLHPENAKNPKISDGAQNCKPVPERELFYHEPDLSARSVLDSDSMKRLVHLDLKGAPPKLSYIRQMFPLLARLGANGLLIEYEDMFPYSGNLKKISASNSYTPNQIEEILSLARNNGLQVIPIIQTFGHMEFVLKSIHLKDMRESEYTPQVINVASNQSYELIRELINQILAAHPSISYLHIGCDEVYELGRGRSADVIVRERIGTDVMFLRHVKRVAQIVAQESNGKVRPIIWDDELRNIKENLISKSGLPSLLDIMVWKYTPNISVSLDEQLWKKYAGLFKSVWVASSFKGATGARQIYTEVQYHIQNHFSWINTFAKYKDIINFKGIALTGWSRYDHFATLCELFPVAIPSLAVCLATLKHGGFTEEIHTTTSKLLECSNPIEMSFPNLDEKTKKALVSQDCRFPGYLLYYAMQQLWGCRQQGQEAKEAGWLSEYQISHRFSNPGQLKVIARKLGVQHANYLEVLTPLQRELQQIYSEDTIEEWLDENINEQIHHIKQVQEKIKNFLSQIHWERRPLEKVVKLPENVKIENVQQGVVSGNRFETGQAQVQEQFVKRRNVNPNVPQPTLPVNGNNSGSKVQGKGIGTFQAQSGGKSQFNAEFKNRGNFNNLSGKSISVLSQNTLKSFNNRNVADSGVRRNEQSGASSFHGQNSPIMGGSITGKVQPLHSHKELPQSKASGVLDFQNIKKLNAQDYNVKSLLPGQELFSQKGYPVKSGGEQKDRLPMNNKKIESHLGKSDFDLQRGDEKGMKGLSPLSEELRKDNAPLKPDEIDEFDNVEELGIENNFIQEKVKEKLDHNMDSPIFQGDKSGLSPKFVEALRKSHQGLSHQDPINKEIFPDLTHEETHD